MQNNNDAPVACRVIIPNPSKFRVENLTKLFVPAILVPKLFGGEPFFLVSTAVRDGVFSFGGQFETRCISVSSLSPNDIHYTHPELVSFHGIADHFGDPVWSRAVERYKLEFDEPSEISMLVADSAESADSDES
jgi:hypothetical protein